MPETDAAPAAGAPISRRARAVRGWATLSANLRASLICIVSFVIFVVMSAFLRVAATHIPAIEILWFRQALTLALLLALFGGRVRTVWQGRDLRFRGARGLLSVGSSAAGFISIANLPLADSNAIGFTEVLFTTVGAALILKEYVGWRRWAATAVGFAGVWIMLSPFGTGLSIYTGLAVLAPFLGALVTVMVRLRASDEDLIVPMVWQAGMTLVVLALPVAWRWVTPTPHDWLLLLTIGLLSFASQWTWIIAFRIGEASAIAPMHFSRLIIAGLIGWSVFGELPNTATLIGAVLVVGATIYTLRRNAVRGVSAEPSTNAQS